MSFEGEPKFRISPELKPDQIESELEIMKIPEIITQPEKGVHLMSLAMKGHNLEWGNRDSELAKLTERYFIEHPLDEGIKEVMDQFKDKDLDEETMYNLAITYQNPERTDHVFNMMERHKNIPKDKSKELQQEIFGVLRYFDGNSSFEKLEEHFAGEMKKDIQAKTERLEESRKNIEGLVNFFRPKSKTAPVERINIIPENHLYRKQSGKSFHCGKELILYSSREDSVEGEGHEFLHSVINPIIDKLDKKLTNQQKEQIVQMASGKLKQDYGQEIGNYYSLLNESFIRTYLNIFEKGDEPINLEDFKERISKNVPNENRFQEILIQNKELKERLDDLNISNLSDLSTKSENYFDKYERDELGRIIFNIYKEYNEEYLKNPNLVFEDFIIDNFSKYIPDKTLTDTNK